MILNLTQHKATDEQKQQTVLDPLPQYVDRIHRLITFDQIPSQNEMDLVAAELIKIIRCHRATDVMIGGAPFFMSTLERALQFSGIRYVYAFSQRECVQRWKDDGSIEKTMVFRHAGFIQPAVDFEYRG